MSSYRPRRVLAATIGLVSRCDTLSAWSSARPRLPTALTVWSAISSKSWRRLAAAYDENGVDRAMVRVLVWGPIFCMATHGCGGKASDNSRATDTPTGGAAQADDDDESPPPPVPLPGAVELCTQWVDAGTCSVRWEDCLRLHGEGSGCDEEVIASIDCLLRGNWDCSKGFLVRLGCDEELDLWDQCLGN